ncbi:MAG TPA: 30S ribosomal protein S4, partial [Alphaproteobacteria bacterium]|nr:30S ribosomal protein S4 [Alphaproteobacteria bacterium]
LVREGDVIEIKEKSRQIGLVMAASESAERDVPEYVQMDGKGFKATFLRIPKLEDVPYAAQMEPNLVVEYYSR